MGDFARRFFGKHPHLAAYGGEHEADEQAALLRAHGLHALNKRLLACASHEVLDIVAEHNVAAMLIQRGFIALEYEPLSMPRPVDLVASRNGHSYRIEVKRLALSGHDELHANVMATLNHALEAHSEQVMIRLKIAELFKPKHINSLVRHVKDSVRQWQEGRAYYFLSEEHSLAHYYWTASAN